MAEGLNKQWSGDQCANKGKPVANGTEWRRTK